MLFSLYLQVHLCHYCLFYGTLYAITSNLPALNGGDNKTQPV